MRLRGMQIVRFDDLESRLSKFEDLECRLSTAVRTYLATYGVAQAYPELMVLKSFSIPVSHQKCSPSDSTIWRSASGVMTVPFRDWAVLLLPVHQLVLGRMPVHRWPVDLLPVHESPIHRLPFHRLLVHRLLLVPVAYSSVAFSPVASSPFASFSALTCSPDACSDRFISCRIRGSRGLAVALVAPMRSLPCKQVLFSLARGSCWKH